MAARAVDNHNSRFRPDLFVDDYKDRKWLVSAGNQFYINPNIPDSREAVDRLFYMIKPLASAYIEIDGLNNAVTSSCLTIEDAVEYVMKLDYNFRPRIGTEDTVKNWVEYMNRVQRQEAFAPDFSQWDKHTRELERLTTIAIDESKKVIEEHNPPDKRLPKELEDGIYTRTRILQNWIKTKLEPIRAREDFVEWKRKKDAESPGSQLRRRRRQREESASTFPQPTAQPEGSDLLQEHGRRFGFQKLVESLQEDLTVWILNLVIYMSCAIIQTISFSRQAPSNPSSSDYLAAVQTTLTQLLSVWMTYVLTSRNADQQNLGLRFQAWFILAGILPLISLCVLRWHIGMSGLVGFVGTAVTGCLQVLLAVHMKKSRFLL